MDRRVHVLLQLYHPESIYIVLVGVEVWTNGDLINVSASFTSETLDNFALYRRQNINPYHNNDNAHLITYVNNCSFNVACCPFDALIKLLASMAGGLN